MKLLVLLFLPSKRALQILVGSQAADFQQNHRFDLHHQVYCSKERTQFYRTGCSISLYLDYLDFESTHFIYKHLFAYLLIYCVDLA